MAIHGHLRKEHKEAFNMARSRRWAVCDHARKEKQEEFYSSRGIPSLSGTQHGNCRYVSEDLARGKEQESTWATLEDGHSAQSTRMASMTRKRFLTVQRRRIILNGGMTLRRRDRIFCKGQKDGVLSSYSEDKISKTGWDPEDSGQGSTCICYILV